MDFNHVLGKCQFMLYNCFLMLSMIFCVGCNISGERTVVVGNSKLGRELSFVNGQWQTLSIENKINDHKLYVNGPEFAITWGEGQKATSDDFVFSSYDFEKQNVIAILKNHKLGLQADIIYTVVPDQPWLYKQIKFTNVADKPFLLRTVELEHLKIQNERVTYAVDPNFPLLSDWGQPVYLESLWFGVEFPAVRSSVTEDGFLFLRHHPGISLASGQSYLTKRAVIGAAGKGKVEQSFMNYVLTLPRFQPAPKMNLYWNGFRVIKGPDRLGQGLKMIEYAKRLKKETGFTFSAWTYDAAFNMYRADALFEPTEADLWDETYKMLKPLGTPVGFWASFSGKYCTPTHKWGQTQGYELQHAGSYCLAGPTYFAAIKRRLEDIVSKYQMALINFDSMYWEQGYDCNEQGHGHLTGTENEAGVYSTERVVENEIEIFRSLRNINPDIIFDFFECNQWASPWWLMEVDGVHTVAGDTTLARIPSPWLRDELITGRDIQVFREHRQQKRQFPLWAEDLYGTQIRKDLVINAVDLSGESTAERWEDEYVMALPGRGAITANIMCSDLGVIDGTKSGLKFFGDVANWTKANERIYRDFHLIGGEPHKRQPYGYSHCDGQGRAIVALRNPYIVARDFQLVIDESLGLNKSVEKFDVNIIYPYRKTYEPVNFGETVKIPLQDYQVMLLDIHNDSEQPKEIPSGVRWGLDKTNTLVIYDESVLADTSKGKLVLKKAGDRSTLVGDVYVPSKSQGGQIQIMIDQGKEPVTKPTVMIDGRELKAEFHERSGGINQDWLLVDIPSGNHQIDVSFVANESKIKIGAWLIVNYELKGDTMAQKIDAPGLFPVFDGDKDRRVITLFESW